MIVLEGAELGLNPLGCGTQSGGLLALEPEALCEVSLLLCQDQALDVVFFQREVAPIGQMEGQAGGVGEAARELTIPLSSGLEEIRKKFLLRGAWVIGIGGGLRLWRRDLLPPKAPGLLSA